MGENNNSYRYHPTAGEYPKVVYEGPQVQTTLER